MQPEQLLRLIAIYLPQFYPIPENDEWWGKGFTEWTNVAKARPRFLGHYQPHLPSDLGFYDLRVRETQTQQAELAKEYGISGFCYYHYWFNGKLLLDRPMRSMFESNVPDFPFMMCWANENWTRAWDGHDKQVLIKQEYSFADDEEHIKYLLPIFRDSRYIKIDGKPVFCIYRASLFPDIKRTLRIWRDEARKAGIELYFCAFESFGQSGMPLLADGFDATAEFQPQAMSSNGYSAEKKIGKRILNKLLGFIDSSRKFPLVYDYRDYVNYVCELEMPDYKRYPCVNPMWDNSPRRKDTFFAFKNSSPEAYYRWLRHVLERFRPFSQEENFVFINAWNEWGEGNYLEPDQRWGRGYLEKTKKALDDAKVSRKSASLKSRFSRRNRDSEDFGRRVEAGQDP